MKTYKQLQEDLFGDLARAAARGTVAGLGVRPSNDRDDDRDTGGRAYTNLNPDDVAAGNVTRTYGLDRRLVSVLQPACQMFGIDLSPSSVGQDPNKYGYNQYYKRANGWTGSPRHVNGLAGDFIVYDTATKTKMPIATYKAGTDESKRIFAFFNYINKLCKRKGYHLSVGAAPGYMGSYTVHIDIARGLLSFPFPYATGYEGSTTKPPRDSDTSIIEYGRGKFKGYSGVSWWEAGRKSGVVRLPISGERIGKTWTSGKPYWLQVLDNNL